MAAQIITIAIEKGGAGKTVTASNLAYLMGDEGKKVLCIDTDPQGNLTSALSGGNGITSGVYNGKALFDMFDGFRYTRTRDYIVETEYENVDMIPCSAQTPRINQRIPGIFEDAQTYFKPGDPKCLSNMGEFLYYFLNQVREDYDYIIIDCPAGIEQGFKNAIAAAKRAIVVTTPEVSAIRDADRIIGILNANEIPRIDLVVNRVRQDMVKRGEMMSVEDVVEILGVNHIGSVYDDENIVIASNRGTPIATKNCVAGRAYDHIAMRICGQDLAKEEKRSRLFGWLKKKDKDVHKIQSQRL